MANISAGNKRSWEGNGSTDLVAKRYRHKDDYARDWRDVHLKSPVHYSDRKRDSSDDRRDYRRESPRRRRSRERDYKRRDYSRDRVRRNDRRRSASPRIIAHIRPPVDDEREEGE